MVTLQCSCPRCGGAFQIDGAWAGQQVLCPHCRSVVAVPAQATVAAPPPPADHLGGAVGPEAIRIAAAADGAARRRSTQPQEKDRRRRVKNVVLWALGLLILGITLAVLLAR